MANALSVASFFGFCKVLFSRFLSLFQSRRRHGSSLFTRAKSPLPSLIGWVCLRATNDLRVTAPRPVRSVNHSLRTQTSLHFQVLQLALDEADHVAGEEHFHLGVAILEELVLVDVRSVVEHVCL